MFASIVRPLKPSGWANVGLSSPVRVSEILRGAKGLLPASLRLRTARSKLLSARVHADLPDALLARAP
jgi:hypothetical protein